MYFMALGHGMAPALPWCTIAVQRHKRRLVRSNNTCGKWVSPLQPKGMMGILFSTSVCNTLVCVNVRLILTRQKCGASFSFCNLYDNGHPHMMMDIFILMPMWRHHISSHCHCTKLVTLSCLCGYFVFLSFFPEIVQGESNTKE